MRPELGEEPLLWVSYRLASPRCFWALLPSIRPQALSRCQALGISETSTVLALSSRGADEVVRVLMGVLQGGYRKTQQEHLTWGGTVVVGTVVGKDFFQEVTLMLKSADLGTSAEGKAMC